MGSHVLPQALHLIPRTPTCCNVKNLGFPSAARVSIQGPSLRSVAFKFDSSAVAVPARRWFVPRAETGSEDGELAEIETAGVVDTVVAEAAEESEQAKSPRTPRIKLGDIMGILNSRAIEASEKIRPLPDIRTGDVVQIKLEVPENKRRLSVYKGIVMSRQNAGIHTTIRIRRIIAGIGVEIVFPVYSPNIKEIIILKHRKVRRARLYYLRDKLPRFSTFK